MLSKYHKKKDKKYKKSQSKSTKKRWKIGENWPEMRKKLLVENYQKMSKKYRRQNKIQEKILQNKWQLIWIMKKIVENFRKWGKNLNKNR